MTVTRVVALVCGGWDSNVRSHWGHMAYLEEGALDLLVVEDANAEDGT
jgi:hypothetical protein